MIRRFRMKKKRPKLTDKEEKMIDDICKTFDEQNQIDLSNKLYNFIRVHDEIRDKKYRKILEETITKLN
jgi:hypothetical protein